MKIGKSLLLSAIFSHSVFAGWFSDPPKVVSVNLANNEITVCFEEPFNSENLIYQLDLTYPDGTKFKIIDGYGLLLSDSDNQLCSTISSSFYFMTNRHSYTKEENEKLGTLSFDDFSNITLNIATPEAPTALLRTKPDEIIYTKELK